MASHRSKGSSKNRHGLGGSASGEVSYVNNLKSPSERLALHLARINFNASNDDLEQPWFFRHIDRQGTIDLLSGKKAGTFLLRPSSRSGNYAMSYVAEKNGDTIVKHNLIYGQFPGFSLKQKPDNSDEIFWSLSSLVNSCDYLKFPLNESEEIRRTDTPTAAQYLLRDGEHSVIQRVLGVLSGPAPIGRVKWELSVMEDPNALWDTMDGCMFEKRTFITLGSEDISVPSIIPFSGESAKHLCRAIAANKSVSELVVKGYEGLAGSNTFFNITDEEAPYIADLIRDSTSLTSLDLSCNDIQDEGACVLATALEVNRHLHSFSIARNFIHDRGLKSLAECLTRNHRLQEYDCSHQLQRNPLAGTSLYISNKASKLLHMIEDTFKRRRELFITLPAPWAQPRSSALPSLCLSYVLNRRARAINLGTTTRTPFHGYLSSTEAERILSGLSPGKFLFYLNQHLPNTLCVCYTVRGEGQAENTPTRRPDGSLGNSPSLWASSAAPPVAPVPATPDTVGLQASDPALSMSPCMSASLSTPPASLATSADAAAASAVVHRQIFRTPAGYVLPSTCTPRPIPTLLEHCAWYLCSLDADLLDSVVLPELPEEVQARVGRVRDLVPLWEMMKLGVADDMEGADEPATPLPACVYPTLSQLVNRNRATLSSPAWKLVRL